MLDWRFFRWPIATLKPALGEWFEPVWALRPVKRLEPNDIKAMLFPPATNLAQSLETGESAQNGNHTGISIGPTGGEEEVLDQLSSAAHPGANTYLDDSTTDQQRVASVPHHQVAPVVPAKRKAEAEIEVLDLAGS